MSKLSLRGLVVAVVCVALAAGAFAVLSEVQAAPCRCPLLWAPVKCSNGKTYSNQCFATCAHATDCVPIGGPLP